MDPTDSYSGILNKYDDFIGGWGNESWRPECNKNWWLWRKYSPAPPHHQSVEKSFFRGTFFLTTSSRRKAIKVPSSGSLIKIFLLLVENLEEENFPTDFSCGNNEHFKVSTSAPLHTESVARSPPSTTDGDTRRRAKHISFNLCVKKGTLFAPLLPTPTKERHQKEKSNSTSFGRKNRNEHGEALCEEAAREEGKSRLRVKMILIWCLMVFYLDF